MDHIVLPNDWWRNLSLHLPPKDVGSARLVCSDWRRCLTAVLGGLNVTLKSGARMQRAPPRHFGCVVGMSLRGAGADLGTFLEALAHDTRAYGGVKRLAIASDVAGVSEDTLRRLLPLSLPALEALDVERRDDTGFSRIADACELLSYIGVTEHLSRGCAGLTLALNAATHLTALSVPGRSAGELASALCKGPLTHASSARLRRLTLSGEAAKGRDVGALLDAMHAIEEVHAVGIEGGYATCATCATCATRDEQVDMPWDLTLSEAEIDLDGILSIGERHLCRLRAIEPARCSQMMTLVADGFRSPLRNHGDAEDRAPAMRRVLSMLSPSYMTAVVGVALRAPPPSDADALDVDDALVRALGSTSSIATRTKELRFEGAGTLFMGGALGSWAAIPRAMPELACVTFAGIDDDIVNDTLLTEMLYDRMVVMALALALRGSAHSVRIDTLAPRAAEHAADLAERAADVCAALAPQGGFTRSGYKHRLQGSP